MEKKQFVAVLLLRFFFSALTNYIESSSVSVCHFEWERREVGYVKTPDPGGPAAHWMADTLQAAKKRFAGELTTFRSSEGYSWSNE